MPVTLPASLPNPLRLVAPAERLDLFDSRAMDLPHPMSPLEGWHFLNARPLPGFALAFWIRDAIAGLFGVKRLGGFRRHLPESVEPGDRLEFFLVEEVGPRVMVLTERDRHLDVMTAISVEGTRLSVTSSVITHNLFGRIYMLPVAPAHRLIVWLMMRRAARD